MAFELVYTSIPHGIKQGTSGFCTAAYTNGLGPNVIMLLEGLSGYKPVFPHYDANAGKNPVSFSHYICSVAGKSTHVLSRVCFCGLDYTKRSNKLAHHIVPNMEEMDMLKTGPASVFHSPDLFLDNWTGEPRLYDSPKKLPHFSIPFHKADVWASYAGDAGWAGVLAQYYLDNPGKPAFIVFDPLVHTDLLSLVDEAIQLIPEKDRWKVTFNTYLTTLPAGVQCAWRFCVAGSDIINVAKRTPGSLILDLTRPMGAATGNSPLLQQARTGVQPQPPRAEKPAAQPAPVKKPEGSGLPAAETKQQSGMPPKLASAGGIPPFQPRPTYGNYSSSAGKSKEQPKKSGKNVIILSIACAVAVLLLAGGGFAGYLYLEKQKPEDTAANAGSEGNEQPGEGAAPTSGQNEKTEAGTADAGKTPSPDGKDNKGAGEAAASAAPAEDPAKNVEDPEKEAKKKREELRAGLWKQKELAGDSADILEKDEQITHVCYLDDGRLVIRSPWKDLKKEGDHTVVWGDHKKDILLIEINKKEWLPVRSGLLIDDLVFTKEDENAHAALNLTSSFPEEFLAWAKLKKLTIKAGGKSAAFADKVSFKTLKAGDKFEILLGETAILEGKVKINDLGKKRKAEIADLVKKDEILGEKLTFLKPGEKIVQILIFSSTNRNIKCLEVQDGTASYDFRGNEVASFAFRYDDDGDDHSVTITKKGDDSYKILAVKTNLKGHVVFSSLGKEFLTQILGENYNDSEPVPIKEQASGKNKKTTSWSFDISPFRPLFKKNQTTPFFESCELCLVSGSSVVKTRNDADFVSFNIAEGEKNEQLKKVFEEWQKKNSRMEYLLQQKSTASEAYDTCVRGCDKLEKGIKRRATDLIKKLFPEGTEKGISKDDLKKVTAPLWDNKKSLNTALITALDNVYTMVIQKVKDSEKRKKYDRRRNAAKKEKNIKAFWVLLAEIAVKELEDKEKVDKDGNPERTEAGKDLDKLMRLISELGKKRGELKDKKKALNDATKAYEDFLNNPQKEDPSTEYKPDGIHFELRSGDGVCLHKWKVLFIFENNKETSGDPGK